MQPNHEYWWSIKQPQMTDTVTSNRLQGPRGGGLANDWSDCGDRPPLTVRLPVTSERYWASFQVTRLFHTVTIFCCYICICCLKLRQADYKVEEIFLFFFTSIWWWSTPLQCVDYLRRILISRPPRVFRRFKRRSFYNLLLLVVDRNGLLWRLKFIYSYHFTWINLNSLRPSDVYRRQ